MEGRTGLRRRNFWCYDVNVDGYISGGDVGSLTINANTVTNGSVTITGEMKCGSNATIGASMVAGGNGSIAGDLVVGSSVFMPLTIGEGIVINNLTADAVITGGMWVCGSAGSATTPAPVATPVAGGYPLGICLTTTASGANPPILVRGYYSGVLAEATVNACVGFAAGVAASSNAMKAAAAGITRGTTVMGAGSEAYGAVYLF